MPKFLVELVGDVTAKWSIEIDAATSDIAEAEALNSAPTHSSNWEICPDVSQAYVDEVTVIKADSKDSDLGRLELEEKYSGDVSWGSHPTFTREMWKQCVAEDDTVQSYWDWVYNKVQNEDEPDEAH